MTLPPSYPDATWLFNQTFAQAIVDPDEPRPGSKAWDPSKWHRVWLDCVAFAASLREGTELAHAVTEIVPRTP